LKLFDLQVSYAVTFFVNKEHRFADTFFDAKESIQRKAPLSRSKARWKIAALRSLQRGRRATARQK